MTGLLRHSIWFGRAVLLAAIFLFSAIALKNLFNPVAAVAPHEITLGSAAGITVARVGFGAFPLGFSIVLATCLIAEQRVLVGLGFLSIIAIVLTAVRVLGAVVDGPAPFTLMVLKPEVALIIISTLAYFVVRRRHHLSSAPQAVSRLAVPR